MLLDAAFWWTAITITVGACAMILTGVGRAPGARGLAALGMLAILAWAGGWMIARSWGVIVVSIAVAVGARALLGATAFVVASAFVAAGSISRLERPEALGLLVGSVLVAAGWVVDRLPVRFVLVPSVQTTICVAIIAVAPFSEAPAISIVAVSVFAVVVGLVWWRSVIDRAMFGRPGTRAAVLAAAIAAIALMLSGGDGAPVMMFATIATLLPFCTSE